MNRHAALDVPIPGDILVIPALGSQSVQVVDVTPWRVTLVHYPDVDRPVAAVWWLWWYRFQCRDAHFLCTVSLWPPKAHLTDDGA